MRFRAIGICVHTDDVASVAGFYRDLLGFEVALDIGWFVSLRHRDRDGVDVCVVHADHAPSPGLAGPVGGLVLAFLLDGPDEVDKQYARLASAGVVFELTPRDEPWGQRRCVARDPAGTGIEFVAATTPDPAWLAAQQATADTEGGAS